MSNLYSRLCAGVIGGLAALVVACGPGQEDNKDAGPDACVSCSKPDGNYLPDASIPDANSPADAGTPDAHYPQADAGCNPNCPTPDAGEPVDAGYVNQVPIVVAYTTDTAGNRKSEFNRGEDVCLRIDETRDPDCSVRGNYCGQDNTGLDYCTWETDEPAQGIIVVGGQSCLSYPNVANINYMLHCFDLETASIPLTNRPYGEGKLTIQIK